MGWKNATVWITTAFISWRAIFFFRHLPTCQSNVKDFKGSIQWKSQLKWRYLSFQFIFDFSELRFQSTFHLLPVGLGLLIPFLHLFFRLEISHIKTNKKYSWKQGLGWPITAWGDTPFWNRSDTSSIFTDIWQVFRYIVASSHKNTPYSYPLYWNGTSLHMRLKRGNPFTRHM